MGNVCVQKPLADNRETYFSVERDGVVLRLEAQGISAGTGVFDIGYPRLHQRDAKIPAAPCLEQGHALDFCNASLVAAPARGSERDEIVKPQDVAASVLVLIDFEGDIDVLLDGKYERANGDAPAVIVFGFGDSENDHRARRLRNA